MGEWTNTSSSTSRPSPPPTYDAALLDNNEDFYDSDPEDGQEDDRDQYDGDLDGGEDDPDFHHSNSDHESRHDQGDARDQKERKCRSGKETREKSGSASASGRKGRDPTLKNLALRVRALERRMNALEPVPIPTRTSCAEIHESEKGKMESEEATNEFARLCEAMVAEMKERVNGVLRSQWRSQSQPSAPADELPYLSHAQVAKTRAANEAQNHEPKCRSKGQPEAPQPSQINPTLYNIALVIDSALLSSPRTLDAVNRSTGEDGHVQGLYSPSLPSPSLAPSPSPPSPAPQTEPYTQVSREEDNEDDNPRSEDTIIDENGGSRVLEGYPQLTEGKKYEMAVEYLRREGLMGEENEEMARWGGEREKGR